jgi:hypothetical protein
VEAALNQGSRSPHSNHRLPYGLTAHGTTAYGSDCYGVTRGNSVTRYLRIACWLGMGAGLGLGFPVTMTAAHAQSAPETDIIAGEELPGIFIEPLETPPLSPEAQLGLPERGVNLGGGTRGTTAGSPQTGQEEPGGNFSLTSPDGVIYDMERGLAFAQRNVEFTYREFKVKGDRGVVDYTKNEATLTGNLTVTVRGQVLRGRTLTFNLDSGQWVLSQIETEFPPDLFPPGSVLEPIYVSNGTVTGQDDEVRGNDFRFSSCDRDHYYVQSKRLDFYRDAQGEPDRIVLKKNKLYVLGKAVAPLPVYVVALQGARSRRVGLQPIVGQNVIDGYFVKTVYDLAANEKKTDSLLIDAMQKRGLGLGFQRELAKGAGLFYLYAITGQDGGRQIDSRIQRNWQITPNLQSSINFQSTKDNPYGGEGTSSQNGNVQFAYSTPNVNSSLFMNYADSSSQFSDFKSFTSSFQHKQDFGSGWSIDANSLYAGNQSLGVTNSSTLDNSLILSNRARLFDTYLSAELHDDLLRNQSYALERLPEIALTTDTTRLGVGLLNNYLPGDIGLGFGSYNEPSTGNRLDRTLMNYRTRQQTQRLLSVGRFQSNFNYRGRFQQSLYSNSTARYDYDYNLALENRLGSISTTLNYFKQRAQGYTPFQFDFLAPAEYVDAVFSYQPSTKLRLNVSGGRDLQNSFTRDIDTRVQWAPSRNFYASLGATYSPESRTFGDMTGNFRIARNPDKLFGGTLDLGIRYSPATSRIVRVNSSLDFFLTKKTRIQALTGYNGVSGEVDFNQIRISRDLHCFNLFATYDGTNRELRFDLALKAFPFVDTRFGVGQFGEGFDSRIGNFN